MPLSLRTDLLRRLLWPMLLLALTGGAVNYLLALRFADDTYDQWLLDSARALAQQVEVEKGAIKLDLPAPAQDLLVWDAVDTVLFRVDSSRRGILAGERSLPVPLVRREQPIVFFDASLGTRALRGVRVLIPPVVRGEDLTVTVAETLNKRRRLADRVLVAVLIPEALLIVLTLILVRRGVSRGLRGISRLEAQVEARRFDDLTPLEVVDAPAELLPFSRAINGLLGRLSSVLDAQGRFVADAAHQLRTPLAALKVEVEHAVRETDPRRHARALDALRAGIDRLVRLSNQLLLLARAEPGEGSSPTRRILDLQPRVFLAASAWVPRALAAGIDLGFEGEERPCPIHGDEVLLGELVNNLIDNALHYVPRGGQVTVRLESGPGIACLEVEDDGPGIPAELRALVLERFCRVPGSPGNGSGLGLAIVREIALAHGASLLLDEASGGGLSVRINFPLAASYIPG